jgi:hypothetical protein
MQEWVLQEFQRTGKAPDLSTWPPPAPEPAEPAQRREKPRPRTKNPRFLSVVHNDAMLWRRAIRTMSLFEDDVRLTFTPEAFSYKSMDPIHYKGV